MRAGTLIATVAGLGIGAAILAYFGFGAVLSALTSLGWGGFAVVLAYRLASYVPLGLCWWMIEPPPRHPPLAFVWGRMVRDAGGDVLPLSQLGGFVMGARAMTTLGLSGAAATATTVVDVTLELLAKLAYTILGVVLLAQLRPRSALFYPAAIGIAIGVCATLCFVVVQRRGAAALERVSKRLAARFLPASPEQATPVAEIMDRAYERQGVLAASASLHLVNWFIDGMGAWVALHLMGVDLGVESVIALESLLYAVRSLAFAVPNAVGVQEGAYVMLGGLFGLAPEAALALSLLKRGRDIVIGVPVLLAWQGLESGARMRRQRESAG